VTTESQVRVGGRFWIKWVIANAISTMIMIGLALVAIDLSESSLALDSLSGGCALPLLTLGLPAGVGISQQFVLRQYVDWAKTWIWVTIGGWVLGLFIAMLFVSTSDSMAIALGSIAFGGTTGMMQWGYVLKRYVQKSISWAAASAIAFVMSIEVGIALSTSIQQSLKQLYPHINNWWERLITDGLLAGAVVGAIIFGSITGFIMIYLLHHPIQQPDQSPSSV
jgi:uncharacterized protein YacL